MTPMGGSAHGAFHWSDAVGLAGTSLILLAYFLLQTGLTSERLAGR